MEFLAQGFAAQPLYGLNLRTVVKFERAFIFFGRETEIFGRNAEQIQMGAEGREFLLPAAFLGNFVLIGILLQIFRIAVAIAPFNIFSPSDRVLGCFDDVRLNIRINGCESDVNTLFIVGIVHSSFPLHTGSCHILPRSRHQQPKLRPLAEIRMSIRLLAIDLPL